VESDIHQVLPGAYVLPVMCANPTSTNPGALDGVKHVTDAALGALPCCSGAS